MQCRMNTGDSGLTQSVHPSYGIAKDGVPGPGPQRPSWTVWQGLIVVSASFTKVAGDSETSLHLEGKEIEGTFFSVPQQLTSF